MGYLVEAVKEIFERIRGSLLGYFKGIIMI